MINHLASKGGVPEFSTPIHVGRPNVLNQERFLLRVRAILDSKWLSNDGEYVRKFETSLAERSKATHVIVFCNATIALETLIRAQDLTGEVIVPSFTFVATAHAVQNCGLRPIFADIDRNSHCLSPSAVEAAITPQTSGILATHVWGNLCDVDALQDIARRHSLKLMFDAAHAFDCSYAGRACGTFGDAEVFSFHATKFLNSFEGGAIATNDGQLAAKLRLIRNFGFSGIDRVECLGTNGKMCEVSAAMGLTNLESIGEILEVNRSNYFLYQTGIGRIPGLKLFTYSQGVSPNFQYIVIENDQNISGVCRDTIVDCLWKENVLARKYFWPCCHNMPPYSTMQKPLHPPLNNTMDVANTIMILPTGSSVSAHDIERICGLLNAIITENKSFS